MKYYTYEVKWCEFLKFIWPNSAKMLLSFKSHLSFIGSIEYCGSIPFAVYCCSPFLFKLFTFFNVAFVYRRLPTLVSHISGRVQDMINRGALRLDNLKLFVLDEADEMLSRGFKDQIYDIFQCLPKTIQVFYLFLLGFLKNHLSRDVYFGPVFLFWFALTFFFVLCLFCSLILRERFEWYTQVCLFSATMPLEIYNLTQRFMRDPVCELWTSYYGGPFFFTVVVIFLYIFLFSHNNSKIILTKTLQRCSLKLRFI